MEAYLDEFRSAIAALKKRLDDIETVAAEPLAKLKADRRRSRGRRHRPVDAQRPR